MLYMRWAEENVPDFMSPERLGFGWKLIHQTIEHQLNGNLEKHWHPAGLELTLSFPIAD